ncbi:MAG: hypothetical protein J7K84_03730, partial [Deltaproteobacteria bacterium]|nr:hypothetical protein [Deltaproteobacteria bacterium]
MTKSYIRILPQIGNKIFPGKNRYILIITDFRETIIWSFFNTKPYYARLCVDNYWELILHH